jgi:hypothetical protein
MWQPQAAGAVHVLAGKLLWQSCFEGVQQGTLSALLKFGGAGYVEGQFEKQKLSRSACCCLCLIQPRHSSNDTMAM